MKVGKRSFGLKALMAKRRGRVFLFSAFSVFGLVIVGVTLHFISINNIALAGLDERYIDVDKYAALNIDYYDPCWGGGSRTQDNGGGNCESISGNDVTWVGDSYTVGSKNLIEEALPGVDIYAQNSKNIGYSSTANCSDADSIGDTFADGTNCNIDGITIVEKLKASGKLRKYLVFALGTNQMGYDKISQLREKAGDDVKIVVTTTYLRGNSEYENVNNKIKEFAEANSSGVVLADWAAAAKDEYYQSDTTHPNDGDGFKVWVETVTNALKSLGGNCGGGVLKGDNNFERVWNAIAVANVDGVSNKNEAIAAMLGNFALENGKTSNNDLNPVHNYALWGENCGGSCSRAPAIDYAVEKNSNIEKHITSSNNADISGVPSDIIDDAIKYEMEYLTNRDTFQAFTEAIKSVTSSGEEAAAEMAKAWEEKVEVSGGSMMAERQGFARNIYKMVSENGKIDIDAIYKIGATDDQKVAVDDNLVADELTAGSIDGGSANIAGSNKNYKGDQVWTDEELAAVSENKSFYEVAADKNGIPWELLATVHRLETGLSRTNGDNGQGAYQFYSQEERDNCTRLNSNADFSASGTLSDDNFAAQSECAANFLKEHYGGDFSSADGLKKLFFTYNGQASVYISQARDLGFSEEQANNGEGSPYVMNRYDEKRDPTVEPTKSNGTWGQIKTDNGPIEYPANEAFGAYLYYEALSGASLGGSSISNGSNVCCPPNGGGGGGTNGASGEVGTLQSKIKELAWDKFSGTANRKKEYDEAVSRAESVSDNGNDCGNFIGILMHESGWDTDYPWVSTSAQESYMSNSDKWTNVTNDIKSESDLMVGDVFINESHTFIFGDVSGFESKYVEASLASPSYAPQSGWNTWESTKGEYRIFRKSNIKTSNTATVLTTEKTTANGDAASKTTTSDPCGGGNGGGSGGNVDENGMSEEDAKKLVQNYGEYSDDSASNMDMCAVGPTCRVCNCACFSEFFVHKFVDRSLSFTTQGSTIVDGDDAGAGLGSYFETGMEPRVWAVFQTSWPHTGVILGKENGKWIVGHASYNDGGPGAGDGYNFSSGGSAIIIVSEDIMTATMNTGTPKFAYLNSNGHKVNIDAINNYVKNGP